jgi:predicted outer membrane repeat protein
MKAIEFLAVFAAGALIGTGVTRLLYGNSDFATFINNGAGLNGGGCGCKKKYIAPSVTCNVPKFDPRTGTI